MSHDRGSGIHASSSPQRRPPSTSTAPEFLLASSRNFGRVYPQQKVGFLRQRVRARGCGCCCCCILVEGDDADAPAGAERESWPGRINETASRLCAEKHAIDLVRACSSRFDSQTITPSVRRSFHDRTHCGHRQPEGWFWQDQHCDDPRRRARASRSSYPRRRRRCPGHREPLVLGSTAGAAFPRDRRELG